jgi:hypothetical protein
MPTSASPTAWLTLHGVRLEVGERGHVVAGFLTGRDGTRAIVDNYRGRRAELGLSGPVLDRFADAALVYTGDTDEQGDAGARKLMRYLESNEVPPQFRMAPGHHPTATTVSAMRAGSEATVKGMTRFAREVAPA